MSAISTASIAGWLLTVALHGGLLLLIAYAVDRTWHMPQPWRELLWRCALFGGVITASLQPLAATSPLGQWQLGVVTRESNSVSVDLSHQARLLEEHSPTLAGESATAPIKPVQTESANSTAFPSNAITHTAKSQTSPTNPASSQTSVLAAYLPIAILAIWIAGALFGLTRLLCSLVSLRRALDKAALLSMQDIDLAALAQHATVREPRLYTLNDIASPMAVGADRIIVPTWAVESLDRHQLRAMLAHELAHIARRDPQWKLASSVWRALFWFLPFANLAQHRLDDLAELACDAFAADHTGDAHSVAECLAACAEHHLIGIHYEFAPAMAERKSSLMHRIDCLLEGVTMQTTSLGMRARAVAVVALAGCALSLPAISLLNADSALATEAAPQPPSPPNPLDPPTPPTPPATKHGKTSSSVSISDNDGDQKMLVEINDANHSLAVEARGKIEFNDDETDVASLSQGGTASFEETRDGTTHRLELAQRNGQLERRYFVDKREQPFDAPGHAWFTALVPSLIRDTGIGAAERVQRIYAKSGASGVLDEIDRINGGYVRGVYLGLLVDHGALASPDLERAIKSAGELDGDYERQQAMSHLFAKQALSAGQQVTFLQQAKRFGGDYERSQLLIGVIPKLADSVDVRQAWMNAAGAIHGDYERGQTLRSMLKQNRLDDSQLNDLIDASTSMGGDYEHGQLLMAIAKHAHDIDSIAPAYSRSAQKIGGDYERSQALQALIGTGKLGSSGANAVLDATAKMGADYERSQVLIALARVMPDDAVVVARYREVASHLADYQRKQAEQALVR